MRALFLVFLVASALPLRAQTPSDSAGYDALAAEIRETVVPLDLYQRQLVDAWDRAVAARRFARADSVAVLAEAALAETTGAPRDSVVWPGLGDRLAIGLLRGDPEAIETLVDDGAWWDEPGAASFWPYDGRIYDIVPRQAVMGIARFRLRPSTANVLAQDSSEALRRIGERGAGPEAVAVARLAIEKLLLEPFWTPGARGLSDEQIALNARADAFLARFPGSRFGRFVRESVRERYRVDGAVSLYLGFGANWATDRLGEATGYSIAGDIGLGVRYGFLHANVGFHGGDLNVRETVTVGDRDLVEGDRLTFALIGVDAGPRAEVAGVDVMPYVSGGLLIQNVSGPDQSQPQLSTYEPSNRLGVGYGVAVEYLGGRARRHGGVAVRLRAGRILPRFSDGFEDALDGPLTTVSLGVTLTGILRTRIDD